MPILEVASCDTCPCMSALYDESAEVCRLLPRELADGEFGHPYQYLQHNTWLSVAPNCPLKEHTVTLQLK